MATLHIEHPITDFDTWNAAFARFADARRRAGVQLRVRAGQRLTGVGEVLDFAAQRARTGQDRATAEGLEAARRDLAEAQADLQELAAGIHPVLLTERGLGPALASLAGRAPVPVRVAAPAQRVPAVIETAVYFTCSEALANVAKHAAEPALPGQGGEQRLAGGRARRRRPGLLGQADLLRQRAVAGPL